MKTNQFFDGQARYTPDFKPEYNGQTVPLTPSQYIQEFLKHYSSYRDEDLTLEVSAISFEPGFYAPDMVSCHVIADYTLPSRPEARRSFYGRAGRIVYPQLSQLDFRKLMQISPNRNTGLQKKQLNSIQTLKTIPLQWTHKLFILQAWNISSFATTMNL